MQRLLPCPIYPKIWVSPANCLVRQKAICNVASRIRSSFRRLALYAALGAISSVWLKRRRATGCAAPARAWCRYAPQPQLRALSADVLYRILVGDIALQRGDAALGGARLLRGRARSPGRKTRTPGHRSRTVCASTLAGARSRQAVAGARSDRGARATNGRDADAIGRWQRAEGGTRARPRGRRRRRHAGRCFHSAQPSPRRHRPTKRRSSA